MRTKDENEDEGRRRLFSHGLILLLSIFTRMASMVLSRFQSWNIKIKHSYLYPHPHQFPLSTLPTGLQEFYDLYNQRTKNKIHIDLSLHKRDHQFYLRTDPTPLQRQKDPVKPVYDFMNRWGQTDYLYTLLHECPLDASSEFLLPIYHAPRDPSNFTLYSCKQM